MTTHDDTTRPANFGRKQGQGPQSDLAGELYPAGVGSEPDGPEIPSRGPMLGDPRLDTGGRTRPASWIDHERSRAGMPPRDIAPDAVAALTIKLADVEAERDELARKVEALSSVRVFNVAGLVEADLAERYTSLRAAHDAQRIAGSEAMALVREAYPSVRLVNDWATWEDSNLFAYVEAHIAKAGWRREHLQYAALRDVGFNALAEIRKVARDRLGDDGFTIPPTYDDHQREAASTALRRIAARGDVANPNSYAGMSTDGERYGDTVDTIARTLGMRRAGA